MRLRLVVGSCVCLGVGLSFAVGPDDDKRPAEPRKTDLVERTERRLVQMDVSVSGPRDAIDGLSREDFELVVGGKTIESFLVDNLCELPDETKRTAKGEAAAETPTVVTSMPIRPRASYLFYFDQNHLTLEGRLRSAEVARDLVDDLIIDGTRGMVISNGRDLRTFAELTDDRSTLRGAIDRMVEAQDHWWDPTADPEETRIREVIELLAEDTDAAFSRARIYAAEERWRTEKALSLLSLVLGRMADLDPPRAVVYFADNLRSNAGEHYLSYFSEEERKRVTALSAAHAFDGMLQEANAMGIRLYAVQARGLSDDSDVSRFVDRRPGGSFGNRVGNTQRIKDAQNSLVGMAMESGGKHFLNGVRAGHIANEIRDDLACLYLISFDPVGLRQDSPLPVLLRTLPAKVKSRVRGRVVVQSESKRLTSRLLAAFAAPDGIEPEFPVRGVVIPTGFDKGKYSALVQMFVPGSPLAATSWDLGLSLVSRGEVREDAAGRLAVTGPGMPVVFETEMRFAPGPFEIVSVAHEVTGNQIATARVEGAWPDPDAARATVGPIMVLQPEAGAFLRDRDLRRSGPVGLASDDSARPDRPTAIIGIVCRGKSQKKPLKVERKLVGASAVDFPTEGLDLGEDRCALFSDLIRAGTMTPGGFRYEVRVLDEVEELAAGTTEFTVVPTEWVGAAGS